MKRNTFGYSLAAIALAALSACGGGGDTKAVCADFQYQEQAQQAFLDGAHQLDGDNDGRACEVLPHQPVQRIYRSSNASACVSIYSDLRSTALVSSITSSIEQPVSIAVARGQYVTLVPCDSVDNRIMEYQTYLTGYEYPTSIGGAVNPAGSMQVLLDDRTDIQYCVYNDTPTGTGPKACVNLRLQPS